MTTGARIATFIAALAVVFGASLWLGRVVGPDERTAAPEHAAADESAPSAGPGGLQSTQDGYTLELTEANYPAAAGTPLQFRILDGNGAPVTRYDESHEKLLHLIVVRNDLTAFQHVHPALDPSGTWRVPVDLRRAGDYRVFADFVVTDGPALTLGANIHVAGEYDPRPLPAVRAVSEVDGYAVTLSGAPKAGDDAMLRLSVSRDGKPVDDLEPYLGAYGHLVALRASDLAYLHVHPNGAPDDGVTSTGPEVEFHTTFPSAGEYRLFLDFQHRGVVRTAEFTVPVPGAAAPSPTGEHSDGDHGH